jgi:hypothetical protein
LNSNLFASLGVGVASWIFQLTVSWIGLFYVLTVLIAAWAIRSWRAAALSSVLCAVFGLLFTPWTCLRVITSGNPDVLSWNPQFRLLASAWLILCVVSLFSIPVIGWLREKFGAPEVNAILKNWLWTKPGQPARARSVSSSNNYDSPRRWDSSLN